MTMTEARPEVRHRIDSIGGIHCSQCDHVIGKLVLKGPDIPKAVLFPGKCKECRHYNVVDLEFLTYS